MRKNNQVGTWLVVFIGLAICAIIIMNYVAEIAIPIMEIF